MGSGTVGNTPACRPATRADSRFIAEMIDVSSEGVAQAAGNRTPLDVGATVYASDAGDYSFRNCRIAEVAGRRAGMLLSFPMPGRDPAATAAPPPFDGTDVFAPYKYLEAPHTWYICGVALLPEHRGRGIGTELMRIARQQARDHGFDRLSLVVFEENAAALALYRRLGYRTIDRAPIVPHPLIRARGDALLMVAPVV
jgi:ribosomal protein S18 acetylase RimI-like enzyme